MSNGICIVSSVIYDKLDQLNFDILDSSLFDGTVDSGYLDLAYLE